MIRRERFQGTHLKRGIAAAWIGCIAAIYLWFHPIEGHSDGKVSIGGLALPAIGDDQETGVPSVTTANHGTLADRESLAPDEENLAAAIIDAAGSNLFESTRALSLLTDPASRLHTIDALVSNWGEADISGALEFAATFQDEAEQQTAIAAAMRGHAQKAPRTTLALANELIGSSYAYDRLAFTVLQSWTQNSPGDALDWASTHLNPDLRAQAFGTFLRWWAEEDPDEAIAWVSTLTVSGVKQEALQALGAL